MLSPSSFQVIKNKGKKRTFFFGITNIKVKSCDNLSLCISFFVCSLCSGALFQSQSVPGSAFSLHTMAEPWSS